MSEMTLQNILTAISGLHDEVAGLRYGLQTAQNRITRLETAIYTPRASSPSSDNGKDAPSALVRIDKTKEPNIHCSPEQKNGHSSLLEMETTGDRVSNEAPFHHDSSRVSACDIRHHLQPINESLATMTIQLSRMEQALGTYSSNDPISPGPSSRSSCHTALSQRIRPASPRKTSHSTSKDASSSIPKLSKLKYSAPAYSHADPSSQSVSRPIFGMPSTPSSHRRVVSFDASNSPFARYSDERSPFAQFTKQESVKGFGTPGRI